MEKLINRKEIYKGKVIHVVCDEVSLDDNSKSNREVVYHNGGVCIGLKHNDKYFMVKQYRYAHEKEMLEFPAGKIEKGENPDEAILREAIEETGYSAKNVIKLGQMIPTCGYSSEVIYLYLGEADEYIGQDLDEDERINVFEYTIDEIRQMIIDGKIDDGKTIALMYQIENRK